MHACARAAGPDGAFALPPVQLALQYVIDLCFLSDVVVRFRTMYVSGADEGNELISDTSQIARRYIRGYLKIDLLAALPLDLPFAAGASGGVSGVVGQAWRLNRLLHAWRLFSFHWVEVRPHARLRHAS